MGTKSLPQFRHLSSEEIETVLRRNHVGRIAYSRDNHIEIQPIHYVYSDGWIYGRTSAGAKVDSIGHAWWPVAFEVDEVDGLFDWRSVVVHGGFYTIAAEGAHWERDAWMKGIGLLRQLIPDAFTESDPTPFRNIIFRIAVQDVSGRGAMESPAPALR